jgi:hypothetical protein
LWLSGHAPVIGVTSSKVIGVTSSNVKWEER